MSVQVIRRRSRWLTALLMLLALLLLLAATFLILATISKLPDSYSMEAHSHSDMAGMNSTTATSQVTDYVLARCSGPTSKFTIEAKEIEQDGKTWLTYGGTIPGTELRVRQGNCVEVTLVNRLTEATTIHWHGVAVPNSADGVAGLTQDAIKPGASYTYRFIAKDAGTYWYHSHQDGSRQIRKGMLGALIVEPVGASTVAHDYTLIYHEPQGLVNGKSGDLKLAAKGGEKVRLRIIVTADNGGSGTPTSLALLGAPFRIVAKDASEIHKPQVISNTKFALNHGERYDLEFVMPNSGQVRLVDLRYGETVSLGSCSAPAAPVADRLPDFDLTSYGQHVADPLADRTSFDASHDIRLGAGFGFYNGSPTKLHTINGKTAPNTPMIMVKEGQVIKINFINDSTDEYHPMHLHGHTFVILSVNGKKMTGSPVHADTVTLPPNSSAEVAFVADNPGLWMIHCHVLWHAATGMMFMVNYEGVGTPFRAGSSTGNIPE